MSGVRTLFPDFPKGTTVTQKIDITVRRHNRGYFVGLSADQLEEVAPELRPVRPITTEDAAASLKKMFMSVNRKLAWAWTAEDEWAVEFRRRVESGDFSSMTTVKDEAQRLWRLHSPDYDPSRATHVPSLDGRGHRTKRSRRSDETEATYRK